MAIALRNVRMMQSLRDETQEVTFARYEAERRLEDLQRYADLFASAAEGIAVLSRTGTLLFANPRAFELLGVPETKAKGKKVRDLVDRDDRFKALALWSGFDAGIFPRGVDLRFLRGDGASVILSCSFAPLDEGEAYVLVSCQDVTEHRVTEEELLKTMVFLESLIEASVEGIVAADLSGEIVLFNPAAERVYGLSAHRVVGKRRLDELFEEGVVDTIRTTLMSEGSGGYGSMQPARVNARGLGGETIPVELSAALIFDRGEPSAFFVILADLREKLRIQQRLAEAQEKLEHSEKQAVLAELAGTAAHELNQPLTSILAYGQLLERRLDQDDPNRAAIETMSAEAERMAEIVRKIGRVTEYQTREYVGTQRILDLRGSEEKDGSDGDADSEV